MGKQLTDHTFLVNKSDEELFGYEIDPFSSFQRLQCHIDKEGLEFRPGRETRISFTISNPYDQTITFENTEFFGIFQGDRKIVLEEVSLNLSDMRPLSAEEERKVEAVFTVPHIQAEEQITFRIGLSFHDLPPGVQGNRVTARFQKNVEKDQPEF